MRGQTTHLDTDVLAEFDAGLTTRRRGARIAAHLAGCDRCRARRDELAAVSAVLAATPAQAMPDLVAQRLDRVLAAEVVQRNNDAERTRTLSAREPATRGRPAGHRRSRLVSLRVLAPATAVVLAAAGYGLSQLAGAGGPQAASSSVAAGPVEVSSPANAAAGRAAVPAVLPPGSGPAARAQRMSGTSIPFVISRTNFMPGTLKQQAEAALRAAQAAPSTQQPPGSVMTCVREVAGNASLLLVESARYQGQAATIIVTRTSQGEVAMVAGAGCSASHDKPLATATVP
jgi:hypothetical protein